MKARNIIFFSLVMLFSAMLRATDRPNFIFIYADDLGWGDLGCYGHPILKTPNLDKMATEGVLLTNFYVANPVCSPSRTAVMTGQYPARHSVHRHFSSHANHVANNMPDFLDPDVTLLTRLMQENGYKTGHFGKWHLGGSKDAPSPSAYGIDVHYTTNSSDQKLKVPRNQSTEKMVDEAIAFIEENKDKPFYVNIWTLVPHANLDPTDEQMAPYAEYGPQGPAKTRGFSTPRQIFYAAVTDMDYHIGRLFQKMDELGLSENTIIAFSSDNGPEDINVVNAAHSGVGSPGPFRGRKRSLYEGGVRVPFIVKWEGHTPAGVIDDQSIVGTVDLLPTFCSLAGIDLPLDYAADGQDVSLILSGKPVERDAPLLWDWTATQSGHTFNKSPGLALRSGKWKFLMNPDGSRKELYDFEADPQCMEVDNLADRYPEEVAKFSEMLLEFKASIPQGAPTEVSGSNHYPMPGSSARISYLEESESDMAQRMKWFTDAKYGMFIHFGLYSQLGGIYEGNDQGRYAEWIQANQQIPKEEYVKLINTWNPKNFNADKIVKLAKEAGMKYLVITTKHHEGFCLWDSEFTEYDIASSPMSGRDFIKELSEACKKQGIHFGTYYSIIDWNHPSHDIPGPDAREVNRKRWQNPTLHPGKKQEYVQYLKNQVKELIEKYDTEILWFDGDWADYWTLEDGDDLYQYIRELKPDIIINNRVSKRKIFKKDFGTPEQFAPDTELKHYWEACYTMNDSWGFKIKDEDWKSPAVVYQKLKDINGLGGNLLLNVGPDGNGEVPEESARILLEVGHMLAP